MSDQRPTPPGPAAHEAAALRQTGASPLRPGDPLRVGPYVPLALLGSGGMGRVYLSRAADDGPGLYAVKVIRPEYAEDTRFRRRFALEASVHSRVGPPHAPELCGTGFHDELLWMATEYLAGLDLAAVVRQDGALASTAVWELVARLGRALAALADAGIVHRDLKPSNVLLTVRGAQVIDFGIAKAADAGAITGTGNRVGTPAYMSPEYLRTGRCDTASDVFSLSGTLVYAATGRAPFGDGTGVDVMHRVAFEEPNPEVIAVIAATDPELGALLSDCLAKDPAARPTPQDLIDTADAHTPVSGWPEPLRSRVLARQRAYETLHRLPVARAALLRPSTHRTGASPGPVRPSAPTAPPRSGATPDPVRPPAPAAPPRSGTTADPVHSSTPAAPPGSGTTTDPVHQSTPAGLRARRPRRVHLIGAAVCVTLAAVTAGLVALTGQDAPATADSPEAVAPPSDSLPGTVPGSTGRPSAPGVSDGAAPAGEPSGPAETGTDQPVARPSTTAAPTATATAAETPAPTPSTSTPASEPAVQPWNSECTHYQGSGRTRLGDSGKRVRQVQCMLTHRGYGLNGGDPEGEFGAGTESAVRAFQSDKGLTPDGIVNHGTWVALRDTE